MTEKPKETPKEELECPKKYVYDTGIIFECKDNINVEIISEDVVDLLNEQDKTIKQLREEIKDFQDILSRKEEELLKPVIRMIDDRIAHYKHKPFSAPVSNPINPRYDADIDRLARLNELKELRKELKMND